MLLLVLACLLFASAAINIFLLAKLFADKGGKEEKEGEEALFVDAIDWDEWMAGPMDIVYFPRVEDITIDTKERVGNAANPSLKVYIALGLDNVFACIGDEQELYPIPSQLFHNDYIHISLVQSQRLWVFPSYLERNLFELNCHSFLKGLEGLQVWGRLNISDDGGVLLVGHKCPLFALATHLQTFMLGRDLNGDTVKYNRFHLSLSG
jgi:hypothetical protein